MNEIDKYYFKQIYGDERRYGQIIINFLSNAIKFCNSDGNVTILLELTKISQDNDQESSGSSIKLNKSIPDKEVLSENSGRKIHSKSLTLKQIDFTMTFKDTGCGISPEN